MWAARDEAEDSRVEALAAVSAVCGAEVPLPAAGQEENGKKDRLRLLEVRPLTLKDCSQARWRTELVGSEAVKMVK